MPREVYNQPQKDGTVIQYDHAGHPINAFVSDEACKDAMGINESGVIRRVGAEFLEATSEQVKTIGRRVLEAFGGGLHA